MLRLNSFSGPPEHAQRTVADGGRVALPSRCRLLQRLTEETARSAGMQRLTLVLAPTGFGKTATITDWLGGDEDGLFPVRWVHCSDAGPRALWADIAAAIAPHSATPLEGGAASPASVTQLARGLHTSLTLVVDDFHLATEATTDMELAELSAESPKLTLIVIGRSVTLLDGPLVSATTRVRLIGAADLSLTPDETAELIESLQVPPSHSLATAMARSEGWPLAIRAALNLGADGLYVETEDGRMWAGGAATQRFDPLSNLNAFAMASLEIMEADARTVILAASQIHAISVNLIRSILGDDDAAAAAAIRYLTEHGFLVEVPSPGASEYRCHQSVRTAFAEYAVNTIDVEHRKRLYDGRAREVAGTAPYTAFRLFCAAEEYDEAAITFAQNFTLITDEGEPCLRTLRALPEEVLLQHPTFTAALLFFEFPLVGVAPARLRYLLRIWQRGLEHHLPQGIATPQGPTHLHLVCEAMVLKRVLGDLEEAKTLMLHLEGRLAPDGAPALSASGDSGEAAPAVLPGNGSLSVFYREIAGTAIAVGDFGRARRSLKRLRRLSEFKISTPWHGFPHASIRTVTDPASGRNWMLAALSELAFADMIDGHVRRAGELLHEYDELARSTGAAAPGISWVGAEVARAHVAEENRDPALLQQAVDRLSPISDRLEPWTMLLIAEAAMMRQSRGTALALAHFVSGLEDGRRHTPIPAAWSKYVVTFEAMLNSSIGNLARAESLLAGTDEDEPTFRLEQARLALFSGNDVEALLLAQSVGDPGATKRQRVDRRLLTAVAEWGCDRKADAVTCLGTAAALIDKYFLPAMLVSVPFEQLRDVAVAARDQGVCDIVDA
ncbi:MAG: hypothetical protein KA158_03220, partial [Leucobacter sp.]|nr:hypothetical protein [Leucobacter sp.]